MKESKEIPEMIKLGLANYFDKSTGGIEVSFTVVSKRSITFIYEYTKYRDEFEKFERYMVADVLKIAFSNFVKILRNLMNIKNIKS